MVNEIELIIEENRYEAKHKTEQKDLYETIGEVIAKVLGIDEWFEIIFHVASEFRRYTAKLYLGQTISKDLENVKRERNNHKKAKSDY
jgi:hypothetical protein